MNQNINLYLAEFRRQKHWLDAPSMAQWTGLLAVLLLMITAVEGWQLSNKKTELVLLEQQYAAAAEATTALRVSFGNQAKDQVLLDDIKHLEETLNAKQALLEFMQGRQLGNGASFSNYLADISHYFVAGLSLQHVDLKNGGAEVLLAGEVLKAELVPVFLQNLSQGTAYKGKIFQMLGIKEKGLTIADGEKPVGNVELSTRRVNEQGKVWEFSVKTASANP